jgi:hypothetical protein
MRADKLRFNVLLLKQNRLKIFDVLYKENKEQNKRFASDKIADLIFS